MMPHMIYFNDVIYMQITLQNFYHIKNQSQLIIEVVREVTYNEIFKAFLEC